MKKRDIAKAILLNKKKEIFVIKYDDTFYDLPGGSVEEGEDFKEAILRELNEETKYTNFKIVGELGKKFLKYNRRGEDVEGEMYCYVVELVNEELSEQTDPEKEIFGEIKGSWMDLDEAIENIKKHKESRAEKMVEFLIEFKGSL